MALTGSCLALVDGFRLINGDISVLGGGTSFAVAFATHASLFGSGMSLVHVPSREGRHQTIRAKSNEKPRIRIHAAPIARHT